MLAHDRLSGVTIYCLLLTGLFSYMVVSLWMEKLEKPYSTASLYGTEESHEITLARQRSVSTQDEEITSVECGKLPYVIRRACDSTTSDSDKVESGLNFMVRLTLDGTHPVFQFFFITCLWSLQNRTRFESHEVLCVCILISFQFLDWLLTHFAVFRQWI